MIAGIPGPDAPTYFETEDKACFDDDSNGWSV